MTRSRLASLTGRNSISWSGIHTVRSRSQLCIFFGYEVASGRVLPRNKFFCCCADLLFQVPFLADYLVCVNGRSIQRSTIRRLLSQGCSVAVQPGGIHEQVHTDHLQEKVFFPSRLGFIRLAIEAGVPLLPAYAFGENQLFHTSDWTRNVNQWFYKKFKVGNLLVHGRLGLVNSPIIPNPLLLPNPNRELHIRWGEAVPVGLPDPDPTDAKVKQVFDLYCASLQKLFHEHKEHLLPKEVADKGLKIVLRESES